MGDSFCGCLHIPDIILPEETRKQFERNHKTYIGCLIYLLVIAIIDIVLFLLQLIFITIIFETPHNGLPSIPAKDIAIIYGIFLAFLLPLLVYVIIVSFAMKKSRHGKWFIITIIANTIFGLYCLIDGILTIFQIISSLSHPGPNSGTTTFALIHLTITFIAVVVAVKNIHSATILRRIWKQHNKQTLDFEAISMNDIKETDDVGKFDNKIDVLEQVDTMSYPVVEIV